MSNSTNVKAATIKYHTGKYSLQIKNQGSYATQATAVTAGKVYTLSAYFTGSAGGKLVEYTYDSWGKQLSCTGTLASTFGVMNPLRYRGYVYDEETGWYYLQSRYYDPEVGRFISADVFLSTGQGVLGCNAYCYCGNNAINKIDAYGTDSSDDPMTYYRDLKED